MHKVEDRGRSAPSVLWLLTVLLACCLARRGAEAEAQTASPLATCPNGAISVPLGASIQDAVERAGPNSAFCLKAGVHRLQTIGPKSGQSFFGETGAVLSGARPLTAFTREGPYWVAHGQWQRNPKHGTCMPDHETCDLPDRVFIDDAPLRRVLDKARIAPGEFYLDFASGRLYLADDPQGRSVEATVSPFAFGGKANNVRISGLTIEKYSSRAQLGAIEAENASGWTIEHSVIRWNSGRGVSIGPGGAILNSKLHHNGQMGANAHGADMLLRGNNIFANNTAGFDPGWEAGGVKIALSDGVLVADNHVHDNNGPGLWCDGDCRNVRIENNRVEGNRSAGIFYEISYDGAISGNILRRNGLGDDGWVWGADIQIAASEGVEVRDNTITVDPGGCGIVLIDQGREKDAGGKYKTRNNSIHDNQISFTGDGCAGGVSDVAADNENYGIIKNGNNVFDRNRYSFPQSSPPRFFWDKKQYGWDEFRKLGQEPNGVLVAF